MCYYSAYAVVVCFKFVRRAKLKTPYRDYGTMKSIILGEKESQVHCLGK